MHIDKKKNKNKNKNKKKKKKNHNLGEPSMVKALRGFSSVVIQLPKDS